MRLKSILTIAFLFYPSPGKTEEVLSKNEQATSFDGIKLVSTRSFAEEGKLDSIVMGWTLQLSSYDVCLGRAQMNTTTTDRAKREQRKPRIIPALQYASLMDESETFCPHRRLSDRTPAGSTRREE